MSDSWIDYEIYSSRNQVVKYYEEEDEDVIKEIQMLELFKHPNVMRLVNVIRLKSKNVKTSESITTVGICMNKETEDLSAYLNREGNGLDLAQKLDFIQQITLGLEYIHSCGIIHTDLKTENILITNKKLKITDFSSSDFIDPQTKTSRTRQLKCTTTHRPPEGFWQYVADLDDADCFEYDQSFDVWSFGIVVLEIMCGMPMYKHPIMPAYGGSGKQDEYDRKIYELISNLDFYRYAKKYIPHHLIKCLELNSYERPTMMTIKSKLY